MRNELMRIFLRSGRILLAIALGGLALDAAMRPVLEVVRPRLREMLHDEESWRSVHDLGPFAELAVAQTAKIRRDLTITVEKENLAAEEHLSIANDAALCSRLSNAVRERAKQGGVEPAAQDALTLAGGVVLVDHRLAELGVGGFESTGPADCHLVLRTFRANDLFDGEGENDDGSDLSDRVTFQAVLQANETAMRFVTRGLRVVGMNLTAISQTDAETKFAVKDAAGVGEKTFEWYVTRPARPAKVQEPVPIRTALTQMEARYIPGLTTLVTAILLLLPYALTAALRVRHRLGGNYGRLFEAVTALLFLFAVMQAVEVATEGQIQMLVLPHAHLYLIGAVGAAAIGAAFAFVAWPVLVGAWIFGHTSLDAGRRMSRFAKGWALIVCGATTVYGALLAWNGWTERIGDGPSPLRLPLAGCAAVVFLSACCWIAAELTDSLRIRVAAATLVIAPLLVVVQEALPEFARGTAIVLALPPFCAMLILLRSAWHTRVAVPRWASRILVVVAVAALAYFLTAGADRSTRQVVQLMESSHALVRFSLLATLLLLLEQLSSAARRPSSLARLIGVVLALAFFQHGVVNIYGAVVIAVAWALLRWWLFVPRGRGRMVAPDVVRDAIRNLIAANEAERVLDRTRAAMQKKVAEGDKAWADFEKHTRELEEAVERKRAFASARIDPASALALGPAGPPWERGKTAARYAAVIALPWVLLFAASLEVPYSASRWLSTIGVLIGAAVQWPLTGFFFGYFFPLIRGESGLSKGLVYFVAIVLPTLTAEFLFRAETGAPPPLFAFWFLQQFIQCVVLGLVAGDHKTLQEAGLRWRHLRDVHNIGVLTAYASSVVVAIGAAMSTAAANGLIAAAGKALKQWLGISVGG